MLMEAVAVDMLAWLGVDKRDRCRSLQSVDNRPALLPASRRIIFCNQSPIAAIVARMASSRKMASTLRENIVELTARQRVEALNAPWSSRLADRITGFTGSMRFVALHLTVFGLWIVVNLGVVPALPRFDPTFVVLAMVASVEAIFLSTFVLISQNRMAATADRRADLDLHVNLLAEHELTKIGELVERIAARLDIPVDPSQFEDVREDIEPSQVLDALDQRKREEGLT